jgi:hypothetical protein
MFKWLKERRSLKKASKVMKSISTLVLISVFLLSELTTAHGGGLNASGCHAGSQPYHCHLADSQIDNTEKDQQSEPKFDRSEYGFRSRGATATTGFYSDTFCRNAESDHVVALIDANSSGAASWGDSLKESFANDPENLVWACPSANRSKGGSGPADYLRKNSDGKGVDGTLKNICAYLSRYKYIKDKYKLTISDKDAEVIASCMD